jgi:hypothetical protein
MMLIFINVRYITPTQKKYYVPILKKQFSAEPWLLKKYIVHDINWVLYGLPRGGKKGQPRVKMRKNGAQTA